MSIHQKILDIFKNDAKIYVAINFSETVEFLIKKLDFIIINLEYNILSSLQTLHLKIPFITIIDQTKLTQDMINTIKLAIHVGTYKCLMLDNINAIIKTSKEILSKYRKNEKMQNNISLIKKSTIMKKTIKEIKQLKNVYIFSFIGSEGCGKKFIAKYFLNQWQKKIEIIECKNNENKSFFEFDMDNFEKNEKITLIMNHPEDLSSCEQHILLNMINKMVGSNIQWIMILNNDWQNKISHTLIERLNMFKIFIPDHKKREEDIENIINAMIKETSKKMQQKLSKKDVLRIKQEQFENFQQLNYKIIDLLYQNNEEYSAKNIEITIDDAFLNMNLKFATKLFEKIYLQKQFDKTNKFKNVANVSKINRTTIYRKLHK